MVHSKSRILVACLAALLLLAARPAAGQVAVATIRSVDALLTDARYLAPFLVDDDLPKQVEALAALVHGSGSGGIDRHKPAGVYLRWPDDLDPFSAENLPVVAFLPVADEARFLDLLRQLACKPEKTADGTYRLTVPGLPSGLALRFARGHAYAARDAGLLRGDLPDPATLLPAGGQKTTFLARVLFDRFPADHSRLVDRVVEQLRPTLEEGVRFCEEILKQVGEDESGHKRAQAETQKLREGLPALAKAFLTGAVEQTKELSLGLDVNPKQHQVAFDLTLVPRSDSGLAGFTRYVGTARSQFADVFGNAELGLSIHLPWPWSATDASRFADAVFAAFRERAGDRYRDSMLKLSQWIAATVISEGLDCGLATRTTPGGEDVGLLVGLKVQNGRKLDHLLRDLHQSLPTALKGDFPVQWNCDRHGAARIHRLEGGDGQHAYLAIRDDVVFVAVGKEILRPLKETLDAFGKTAPAPTPLVRFDASAAAFARDEPFREAVRKEVPAGNPGKLRAHVRLEGGDRLQFHLDANVQFLKLLLLWGNTDDEAERP